MPENCPQENKSAMPSSLKTDKHYTLVSIIPVTKLKLPLPLYGAVSAGFPSPADDYLEQHLDLNEYLIKNPSATFFVRVEGDSMTGANIQPGNILIVDRSLEPCHNDIVIAVLNGAFTVKRFYKKRGVFRLVPENPNYHPILIKEGDEFIIWGVVAHVLNELRS
jgi:DNA polymerase V